VKNKLALKQYNKYRSFNLKVGLEEVEQMAEFHKDQFICFSKDKKFQVCSVTSRDFDKLVDVYESYMIRTVTKESLLAKWFGLFEMDFSGVSVYVYVIENLACKEGSEVVIKSKELLKDLIEGERNSFGPNSRIHLKKDYVQVIYNAMVADTRVLAKFNYLGYSLWSVGKEQG